MEERKSYFRSEKYNPKFIKTQRQPTKKEIKYGQSNTYLIDLNSIEWALKQKKIENLNMDEIDFIKCKRHY